MYKKLIFFSKRTYKSVVLFEINFKYKNDLNQITGPI